MEIQRFTTNLIFNTGFVEGRNQVENEMQFLFFFF